MSNHIAWLSAPSSVIQALESSLMWLVLMMSLVLLLRLKLVSYLDVGLFAACCCCLGGFLGKSTQLLGNVFQFLIFKCATMPPYSAAWRHTFSIWRMPGILSFFFVCRWNDTNSWQRIWQEFLWGFAMQPAQAPSIIWSWISSGSFLLNWNWTYKASQTNWRLWSNDQNYSTYHNFMHDFMSLLPSPVLHPVWKIFQAGSMETLAWR